MVNEKIQNVLSRLEKDIDYENSHRDEVPSEKRLNCISKNIGTFYNIMLKSIHAKNILEIGMSVGYSGLWFADAIMSNTKMVKLSQLTESNLRLIVQHGTLRRLE